MAFATFFKCCKKTGQCSKKKTYASGTPACLKSKTHKNIDRKIDIMKEYNIPKNERN